MDQSKKTMRHFYCRDVLWETFEQMANDFDCSIDYLVNEAMRYYARSKNYQSPGGPPGGTQGAPAVAAAPGPGPGGGMNNTGGPTSYSGGAKPGNGMRGQPGTQPPPAGAAMQGMRGRAQPPTPGYQGQGGHQANLNVSARTASPTGVPGGPGSMNAMPHPAAGPSTGASPMPMGVGGGPTLFLIYNGQRYPVTKDQFIIGRGSKTSDLPIKDGNISRKHAAVIRRNGTFYIKDLGSTNGIDYKGMRIDNKRIDEGDVFHLCDYELRFTYRAD
jgi:hypothetical protein